MKIQNRNHRKTLNRYTRFRITITGFVAFFAILCTSQIGSAQGTGSLVALGKVNSDGTLANSANSIGATLTSVRSGTGDYLLTLNATGAFVDGGTLSNYIVEVTVNNTVFDDDAIRAQIAALSDNEMRIRVNIDDVEDTTNSLAGDPRDNDFCFAIHHIETGLQSASTPFVLATGRVRPDGTIIGVTVPGLEISLTKGLTGAYTIELTGEGAFVGDSVDDYVLILTSNTAVTSDHIVNGDAFNATGEDLVTFAVRTADAESATNAPTPTAVDSGFYYTIYRIPSDPAEFNGPSPTALALARLSGNGFSGGVRIGGSSIPGANFDVNRIGAGLYQIRLNATGRFAGLGVDDFVLQATYDAGGTADQIPHAFLYQVEPDFIFMEVSTDDVENGTDSGVQEDGNFFLSIYAASAEYQPDLRIGKKGNVFTHKGDDIYNSNGARQKLRVPLKGTRNSKFFLSLQNDGNVGDALRLKSRRVRDEVKIKYIRLDGGRANVTAAVLARGAETGLLNPGEIVRYLAKAKYTSRDQRHKERLRIAGRSVANRGRVDVNQAILLPK